MRLWLLIVATAAIHICTTAQDANDVGIETQQDAPIECTCPAAAPLPPRGNRCEPLYAGMEVDGDACNRFSREDCSNPIVGAAVGMTCPQMCSCKGPTSTTRTSTTKTTTTKSYTSTTRTTKTETATTTSVSTTSGTTTATVTTTTGTATTATATATTVTATTVTTATASATSTTTTSVTTSTATHTRTTSTTTTTTTTMTICTDAKDHDDTINAATTSSSCSDLLATLSNAANACEDPFYAYACPISCKHVPYSNTCYMASDYTVDQDFIYKNVFGGSCSGVDRQNCGAMATLICPVSCRATSTSTLITTPTTTPQERSLTPTTVFDSGSGDVGGDGDDDDASFWTVTVPLVSTEATVTVPLVSTEITTASTPSTASTTTPASTTYTSTTSTTISTTTGTTKTRTTKTRTTKTRTTKTRTTKTTTTETRTSTTETTATQPSTSTTSTSSSSATSTTSITNSSTPRSTTTTVTSNTGTTTTSITTTATTLKTTTSVDVPFSVIIPDVPTSTSTRPTTLSTTAANGSGDEGADDDAIPTAAVSPSSTAMTNTTSTTTESSTTPTTTTTTSNTDTKTTSTTPTATTVTSITDTTTTNTTPTATTVTSNTDTATTSTTPTATTVTSNTDTATTSTTPTATTVTSITDTTTTSTTRSTITMKTTTTVTTVTTKFDCSRVIAPDHPECNTFTEADCSHPLLGGDVRLICVYMCKVCEAPENTTVIPSISMPSATSTTAMTQLLKVGGSASGSSSTLIGSGSLLGFGVDDDGNANNGGDADDEHAVGCDADGDSHLCASFSKDDCESLLMAVFMHPNCPHLCGFCDDDNFGSGNDDDAARDSSGSGDDDDSESTTLPPGKGGSGGRDNSIGSADGTADEAPDGGVVDDVDAGTGGHKSGDLDRTADATGRAANVPSPTLVDSNETLVCVYAVSSLSTGGGGVEAAAAAAAANVAKGLAVSHDPLADVVGGTYSAFPSVCRDPAAESATRKAQSTPTKMADYFFEAASPLMKGYHCDEELWAGPDHCDCIVLDRPEFATYSDWVDSCCESTCNDVPPFATSVQPAVGATTASPAVGITGKPACGCEECVDCSDDGCNSIYPVCYAQSINIAVVLEHGDDGALGTQFSQVSMTNAKLFLRRLFAKLQEELAKAEPRVDRIGVQVVGVSEPAFLTASSLLTLVASIDEIQHTAQKSLWSDFYMGESVLEAAKMAVLPRTSAASMSAVVVFADGSSDKTLPGHPSFHASMVEYTRLDFARKGDGQRRDRRNGPIDVCECKLCNGLPDPLNCDAYSAEDCVDLVVGSAVSYACPALCGTCTTSALRLVFETLDIAHASLGILGDSIQNAVLSVGDIQVAIKYSSGSIIAELLPNNEGDRAVLLANLLLIRNGALDSYVTALSNAQVTTSSAVPAATMTSSWSGSNSNGVDLASSGTANTNNQASAGANSMTLVAALLTTIVVVSAIVFVAYAIRNYRKVRGNVTLNPDLNNLYQLDGEMEDLQTSIQPVGLDRTTSVSVLPTPARRDGFPTPAGGLPGGDAGGLEQSSLMPPFSMDGSGATDVLQSSSVARLIESRKKMNATMAAAFDLISSPIYSFSDPNNSSSLQAADPGISMVSGPPSDIDHQTPERPNNYSPSRSVAAASMVGVGSGGSSAPPQILVGDVDTEASRANSNA